MPRFPRARASQQGSAGKAEAAPKAVDVSGWLDEDAADQTLRRLCGLWRDHMGSTYSLRMDSDGVMEVRTTRPRGKTMRTRGIIRIQWKDAYGRVVWGRAGARALFTIAKLDESSLIWQSNRSKPFHWDRQEPWDDEEEPEAEETGSVDESNAEDHWAWNAPYSAGAWEEGWEEGWDEGWDEGWQEEEWQDDDWAEEPQDTTTDAVQRRVQLRRQLQETRRQVAAQTTAKTDTGEQEQSRWKQKKFEKPVYRKVERQAEPEKPANVSHDPIGDAKATTEALKSMLGISTRTSQKKGAKTKVQHEKHRAAAAEAAAEPEPAPGAAQDAAPRSEPETKDAAPRSRAQAPKPKDTAPRSRAQEPNPKEAAPKAPKPRASPSSPSPHQDAGHKEPEPMPPTGRQQAASAGGQSRHAVSASGPAAGSSTGAAREKAATLGRLPLSGPGSAAAQEQQQGQMKHGCEVGERVLHELCPGVAGHAGTAPGPTGPAAAAAAMSSDAVHVNRLEHVVQGFLGQPWFTPAWSSNTSGWAFDLQWVTSTLEWYFSDMNLRGDLYLRSLMMPNEGWVPLMLLQAFPRLQSLGVDHAVIGQAAMVSSSLELDTTGHYTRIRDKNRRAQWLPVRTG